MRTGNDDVKVSLFRHGGVCLQPECSGNLWQEYDNMEVSLGSMMKTFHIHILGDVFSCSVIMKLKWVKQLIPQPLPLC